MRFYLLILLMVLTMSLNSFGADKKKEAPGKIAAMQYFESLMSGNIKQANQSSTVPFSFDRKEVLLKKEDVEEKHNKILAKKGKRPVPMYKISPTKVAPKLDRNVFPDYDVYCIVIAGDDEKIYIYVTKGKNPKCIGFSD